MRVAVGAGRARLVQQMIVECGLIAAAACVVGLAFAQAAAPALVDRLMPSTMPAYLDLQLNARVFLFVALAGLAATLLFGAIPALRASSVSPDAALKSGGRSSVRTRALRPLIAAQVGFSFVVLFVSGLLLVSFRNLMNVDLGFTKQGVILLGLDGARLGGAASNRNAILTTLDRIRRQPGVQAASMSNIELVAGPFAPLMRPFVRMPGQANPTQGPLYLRVAPGFFNTMQIRTLGGRDFTAADLAADAPSVIVNQAFARKYFPGGDPLGRRFERGDDVGWAPQQIVGVVVDAKYNSLRETPSPTVYEPLRWVGAARLAVRTSENPAGIGPLLRQAVAQTKSRQVRVTVMELESKKIQNGILPERLHQRCFAGFWCTCRGAGGRGTVRSAQLPGGAADERDRDQDGAGRAARRCGADGVDGYGAHDCAGLRLGAGRRVGAGPVCGIDALRSEAFGLDQRSAAAGRAGGDCGNGGTGSADPSLARGPRRGAEM